MQLPLATHKGSRSINVFRITFEEGYHFGEVVPFDCPPQTIVCHYHHDFPSPEERLEKLKKVDRELLCLIISTVSMQRSLRRQSNVIIMNTRVL